MRFVNRNEWDIDSPLKLLPNLVQPIDKIVIAHTNGASCLTEAECIRQVQFLHALYTESKQKLDIPFNFLIGGDGRAYEATGWTYQADSLRGISTLINLLLLLL